jgi:hypothetical protein
MWIIHIVVIVGISGFTGCLPKRLKKLSTEAKIIIVSGNYCNKAGENGERSGAPERISRAPMFAALACKLI